MRRGLASSVKWRLRREGHLDGILCPEHKETHGASKEKEHRQQSKLFLFFSKFVASAKSIQQDGAFS